ncbi:MAG: universal stress protein [Dehalococcoidales bacterium]
MYQRILVPLDGSKISECSLEHMKAIALGCKVAEVTLLTVVEEPPPAFPESAGQQAIEEIAKQREKEAREIEKRAGDYLAKVAGTLRKEGIPIKAAVIRVPISGGVADTILDYVKNNKVDLIIMSTHGRSGISRWAFGSVTDKVIRHAHVPVLSIAPAGYRVS